MDNPVRRAVWRGEVPVLLRMASEDVAGDAAPDPVLVMSPRVAYLPLVAAKAIESFHQCAAPAGTRCVWFESADGAVKWHLPVGVAFDAERVRRGEDAAASLPWRVTVHLTGNPPKGVLPLRGEPEEVQQTARWHYTHALKQGTQVLTGSDQAIKRMSKGDQEGMWTALAEKRFSAFWDANAAVVSRQPAGFPLRLLVIPGSALLQPVVPLDESPTLGQAIRAALPNRPTPTALLHGAPAPLEASCADLARSAAYADNFVYVAVRESEA